ncbi:hypothetical protein O3P69_015689 [Scylla paramamosain]|uniref:Uncharacterized protein n=1 Tax=Scylla paramamosain TaxID=85552 RepID=A0AAW0SBU4_SCYPA
MVCLVRARLPASAVGAKTGLCELQRLCEKTPVCPYGSDRCARHLLSRDDPTGVEWSGVGPEWSGSYLVPKFAGAGKNRINEAWQTQKRHNKAKATPSINSFPLLRQLKSTKPLL